MKLSKVDANSEYLLEVVKWLNDKNHMQFSNQRLKNHTLESQKEYCQTLENEGNFYFFGFEGELLIGTVSILVHRPHKTAEIGILISNQTKGKGFGKSLFGVASDYTFEVLKCSKLRAGCLSLNVPMIKIFESCGFSKEAVLENEEIWEDKRVDVLIYAKHIG